MVIRHSLVVDFKPTMSRLHYHVLITFSLTTSLAFGNIGDDIGQLRKEFGSAMQEPSGYLFLHDGFSITALMDSGHAAIEIFLRDPSLKSKGSLTREEVQKILAQEAAGFTWVEGLTSDGSPEWSRSDGKVFAKLVTNQDNGDRGLYIQTFK